MLEGSNPPKNLVQLRDGSLYYDPLSRLRIFVVKTSEMGAELIICRSATPCEGEPSSECAQAATATAAPHTPNAPVQLLSCCRATRAHGEVGHQRVSTTGCLGRGVCSKCSAAMADAIMPLLPFCCQPRLLPLVPPLPPAARCKASANRSPIPFPLTPAPPVYLACLMAPGWKVSSGREANVVYAYSPISYSIPSSHLPHHPTSVPCTSDGT